jgi:hypothetical protein
VNGRFYIDVPIEKGELYSFRIVAYNDGGKSFPSETLCVGVPEGQSKRNVLVVNDFYRVGPPAWFDTPAYAGFDNRLDSGVPYIYEINFIGEQYQFRRDLPWLDDDNPGFGGSYGDMAGKKIAGNTFDFASVHASRLLSLGYTVWSSSEEAFSTEDHIRKGAWAADIVCGKQVTTPSADSISTRYRVFPERFQEALKDFTSDGGNILISGADIGTDVWDQVYPVAKDSAYTADTKKFITETLGYKWLTNYASRTGQVWVMKTPAVSLSGLAKPFNYCHTPGNGIYCVETPDGILPSDGNGATFLRYQDTNISAGVCYSGDGYKVVSLGFPIETVTDKDTVDDIFRTAMGYFENK